MDAFAARTSVSFIRSLELLRRESARSLRICRTPSFSEDPPPLLLLLAFLSWTHPHNTVSDPPIGFASRGENFRYSGSLPVSLSDCCCFIRGAGVASCFLSTLRRTNDRSCLRVRSNCDEVYSAPLLWDKTRGIGDDQSDRCLLCSAGRCSFCSPNFRIGLDSSKIRNLGSCNS